MKISELSEVDRKVIDGIDNAVRARGADWRYPNGHHDGEQIAEEWNRAGDRINNDPDWTAIDGTCYNLLPNGDPACIIGFVAVDQGLPTERESSAGDDAERWGVSGYVGVAMVLAQTAQDQGFTWGVARQRFYGSLSDRGIDTEGREVVL